MYVHPSGKIDLEEELTIAYLGPEGTHSEGAVIQHFGSSPNRSPRSTTTTPDPRCLLREPRAPPSRAPAEAAGGGGGSDDGGVD